MVYVVQELRSLEWLWKKILNYKDSLLLAFNVSQGVVNLYITKMPKYCIWLNGGRKEFASFALLTYPAL